MNSKPSDPGPSARSEWVVRLLLAVLLATFAISGCSGPAAKPVVTAPQAPPRVEAEPRESPKAPSAPAAATDKGQRTTAEPGESLKVPSPPADTPKWSNLFDGKTLGGWQSTQFGGEGDVTVEDGKILLAEGNDLTGVHWKGEPPARMNYEIELEAMRVVGHDFFCGLTFPVGKDSCSLICGGWGGGVTGLSSLDGNDASQNETSQWINYDSNRWYRIRVRVTEKKIQAWLDDKQIVDVETAGRKIGIRIEVDASKPLGIATWRTTGALRNIRLRQL